MNRTIDNPVQVVDQFVQSSPHGVLVRIWLLAFIGLAALVVYCFWVRSSVGISRNNSALLFLISLVAGGVSIGESSYEFERQSRPIGLLPGEVCVIFAGFLALLAFPFCVRIYLKWQGTNLTEAEKRPGMPGVHEWLRAANLLPALLIALCAWQGLQWSFWGVLLLNVGLLVAYPIYGALAASPAPGIAPESGNIHAERERVLKLLEDGRITPEDCSELLNALGHSSPPRPVQTAPATPHRKLVLTGLALVLIGFFLPWFSINMGNELSQSMGQMQQSMNQFMPQNFHAPTDFNLKFSTASTFIAGGDIPHGLGWCILLLGAAAALLPWFAGNLEPQALWKSTLAALGGGALILLYLLTGSFRFASVGILLVAAGYVLQFVGAFKERPLTVN